MMLQYIMVYIMVEFMSRWLDKFLNYQIAWKICFDINILVVTVDNREYTQSKVYYISNRSIIKKVKFFFVGINY